jgi:hypothetical protein
MRRGPPRPTTPRRSEAGSPRSWRWKTPTWRCCARGASPPTWLRYEDIAGDLAGTVALVARALGEAPPAATPAPSLTRLADGWNAEAEARFRAERHAEVAAFEAARRVRRRLRR